MTEAVSEVIVRGADQPCSGPRKTPKTRDTIVAAERMTSGRPAAARRGRGPGRSIVQAASAAAATGTLIQKTDGQAKLAGAGRPRPGPAEARRSNSGRAGQPVMQADQAAQPFRWRIDEAGSRERRRHDHEHTVATVLVHAGVPEHPGPVEGVQHLVQRLVQVEQDIIVVLRPAEAGDVDGEQPAYLEPPPLWGSKTRSAVAVALR